MTQKHLKLNTLKFGLLISSAFIFSSVTADAAQTPQTSQDYTLEQVVILSRHNVRAPAVMPSTLNKVSEKKWDEWDVPAGYLTPRGGELESYLGHYFEEWLADNKLLTDNVCPTNEDIRIYTNSIERTIATGQFFAIGAFPSCNVPVYHKYKVGTMDELFDLSIRDDSDEFKQQALASIAKQADEQGIEGLNEKLKPIYQDMINILDYQNSKSCKQDKQCDFIEQPASLQIIKGKLPDVDGALLIGALTADAWTLQYYNGEPIGELAWGEIKSEQQLARLASIKDYYNFTLFSSPAIARHVAKNLLTYIDNTFTNPNSPKITLLVGHDSNIISVGSLLGIKPYRLPNQFELNPIGGKIVFERWKNNKSGEQLMKIEYVYQSTEQLINMQPLSRNNPAQHFTLEMKACPINAQGFCSYSQFMKILGKEVK